MKPEQLWETTMDPMRRTLSRSRVDDAEAMGSSVLMGDQVELRRQFIEDNALRVRNLDDDGFPHFGSGPCSAPPAWKNLTWRR